MASYYVCSKCGANLDPGEKCNCHLEVPLYRKKTKDMSFYEFRTYRFNKALGLYDEVDDINDEKHTEVHAVQ